MVVTVPSVGQAVGEADAPPSKVAAQPMMEVMLPPTSGQMELSAAPITLTTVGASQPDKVPPTEADVMVATTDGSQLGVVVVASEVAARPVLPAALETTPVMGRTKGVMAQGPSDTTAVAEETDRELSLVLPSEGRHPPMRDEPSLRWVSPWDPSLELFTLDDATEGMEREKFREGFMAMLEALNQASGTL